MVVYNFKIITTVPSATELIDIVLSGTQRKTPTEIHPNYQIERIRGFYMRKVKFTQNSFHDRMSRILDQFPKLDDVHPFYADLMNVLYDRNHYKLALGQIRQARTLIDTISKDYVKQLKYGDSLDRCKRLKRAAVGRMCTIAKKLGPSLSYLEQVRQHLSRLPSIDPSTRTLILSGMPSVGKSSFMNALTNANVEVQPYPFTTKSLYVGQTHHRMMDWQVIDTPGLLDHALDDRNTIEMQAITALAHLRAAVVYIIDPSEYCGQTLAAQIRLYHSIRPLFANKPLVVVLNKTDLWSDNDVPEEAQAAINGMALCPDGTPDQNVTIMRASTLTLDGVVNIKETACDALLAQRVATKLASSRADAALARLHVAVPGATDAAPLGGAITGVAHGIAAPVIPEGALEERAARAQYRQQMLEKDTGRGVALTADPEAWAGVPKPRTALDEQREWRGIGEFSYDFTRHHMLEDDSWRHDAIPEIWQDLNVADFIDPEIDNKLAALEAEEAVMLADFESAYDPALWERYLKVMDARASKYRTRAQRGARGDKALKATAAKRLRTGIETATSGEILQRTGVDNVSVKRIVAKAVSEDIRNRGGDVGQFSEAEGKRRDLQRRMGKLSLKSDADRSVPDLKPKWIFAGKMGFKRDWN